MGSIESKIEKRLLCIGLELDIYLMDLSRDGPERFLDREFSRLKYELMQEYYKWKDEQNAG